VADSSIDLAAPAGLVDARTEATDGKKRQVISIGDPSTKLGIAPVDATHGLKVDLARVSGQTLALGSGANGATVLRVALATDSPGVLAASDYETVAASQTDQMLGATGAVGDYLSHVLVIPATTSPGPVAIQDGNGSAITVFTGGASSVSNLIPFPIPVEASCTAAVTPGWQITTGANVSVLAVGSFT
jgi:hypothetical protein